MISNPNCHNYEKEGCLDHIKDVLGPSHLHEYELLPRPERVQARQQELQRRQEGEQVDGLAEAADVALQAWIVLGCLFGFQVLFLFFAEVTGVEVVHVGVVEVGVLVLLLHSPLPHLVLLLLSFDLFFGFGEFLLVLLLLILLYRLHLQLFHIYRFLRRVPEREYWQDCQDQEEGAEAVKNN